MKMTVLLENTCHIEGLQAEHGLSLYLETPNHKMLFDAGTTDLFAQNADALGIDLAGVDIAVLSHGHRDHGGGMGHFLARNEKAKVYMRESALEKHFSQKADGLHNAGIWDLGLPRERMVFTGEVEKIDEELTLFSGVTGRRFWSDSNSNLMKEEGDGVVLDDFVHEHDLVISAEGKKILIAGCSHNGIANILDRYHELFGDWPDAVIGGLHLLSPGTGRSVPEAQVRELGAWLKTLPCKYYTGHCTGAEAYATLKDVLGDQIDALTTGKVFEL